MVLFNTICVLLFNFERRFEVTNSDNQPGNLVCFEQANDDFPTAKCNQFAKLLSPEIDVSFSEI